MRIEYFKTIKQKQPKQMFVRMSVPVHPANFFKNLLHVNEMAKKVVVYWFFSSQSSNYCYKIIKDCLKQDWPLHWCKNVFMNAIIQSFIGQVVWVRPSCSLRSLGGVLKELNQSIKTKIKKMVVLEFLKTRN